MAAVTATACSTAAVSTAGLACDAAAADTSTAPLDRRANPSRLVIPDFRHGRPTGEVIVWPFVNRRGRVDSIRLVGRIHESYERDIRRAVSAMRFWPAERNGCPVASWADSLVMTFAEQS